MGTFAQTIQKAGVVWVSPWEYWAWGLACPWGAEATRSTATCSFQTARAKQFSRDRKNDPNRCRLPGCLKCPGGLAWAGWGEHWRNWVLAIWCLQLRTGPWWVGTKYEVPPHHKDKVSLGMLLPQLQVEPNVWGHAWKVRKNWQSPKICRALLPGRTKYGSRYETKCTQTKGNRDSLCRRKNCMYIGQNVTVKASCGFVVGYVKLLYRVDTCGEPPPQPELVFINVFARGKRLVLN